MEQDYDDYIVFLLGADTFTISHKIRELAREFGMDGIFEDCVYIAQKFNEYDKLKYNLYSQYESFERFLEEYDAEINNYLEEGIKFEIKEI